MVTKVTPEAVLANAAMDDPDWGASLGTTDWRFHIGPRLREVWSTLDRAQKAAAAGDAEDHAAAARAEVRKGYAGYVDPTRDVGKVP